MKQYLIDTFRFNDWANRLTLSAMANMPEPKESTALFSHLLTAQNKWMRRIENDPQETAVKWWDIPYQSEELEAHWETSFKEWLDFLSGLEDDDLNRQIKYKPGADETSCSTSLRDVVLQLNYHSILHRAQICLRLQDQGIEPPHVDYIYYIAEKN